MLIAALPLRADSSQSHTTAKLAGVHGLRGVAALCVVLFHLAHIVPETFSASITKPLEPLFLSVQLFFVISAFTLTHSQYISPLSAREYLFRRLARIAPLYWLILLGYLVWFGNQDWRATLLNLTFLFNLVPGYEQGIVWAGWSVGVEMVFYVLLPLLWLKLPTLRWWLVVTFVAIAASELLWLTTADQPSLRVYYAYFTIVGNLPQFLFGVLAYLVFQRNRSADVHAWLLHLLGALAIGLLALLLLRADLVPYTGIRMAAIGFAFSVICGWQAMAPSRVLSIAHLHWVATRSYGIYLIHAPVIHYAKPFYTIIVERFGSGPVGFFVCALATYLIVLGAAHLLYHTIELPAMRRITRWAGVNRS